MDTETGARRGGSTAAFSIALVGLAMAFQLATLREGQAWGDDFALYLLHAGNLAEGRPYAATNYVHEPGTPLSPAAYPPGLPLLLAPAHRGLGLNFTAFKCLLVACLALGLAAACLLFRRDLPPPYLAAFAGLSAFSPALWDFKENVLSEFPYVLFLFAAALVASSQEPAAPRVNSSMRRGIVLGLLMGAAAETRSIGLLLLPALGLSDLLSQRRLTPRTWWAIGVAGALTSAMTGAGGGGSYAGQFAQASLAGVRRNLRLYLAELVGILPGGNAGVVDEFFRLLLIRSGLANSPVPRFDLSGGDAFALGVAALAVIGWARRVTRRVTLLDVYAPLHLLAVAAFPVFQGSRYVLPLLPLVVFYALLAVHLIGRRCGRSGRFAVLSGALTWAAFYGIRYATFDYGPLREGIGRPEARAFFAAVREHTDRGDLIIFGKPRALALMTERRSAEPCRKLAAPECWDRLDRMRATHIGTGPFPDEHEVKDFVEGAGARLQLVSRIGPLALYRIRPGPQPLYSKR